jgi:hypothetical protein
MSLKNACANKSPIKIQKILKVLLPVRANGESKEGRAHCREYLC